MSCPPVLTTAQVRDIEERAARGLAGPTLMQRAGRATADAARALAADTGAPVLVVAGPGNNGGDAWVAAAHLRESFHRVTVLDVAGTPPKAPEAREARERFLAAGGESVRAWPESLHPGLVVDGLLGIGLARDLDGDMAALVGRVNGCAAPVLAIDIPSGIASDTGSIRGAAVRATRTITFLARKIGLHTGDALDCTGDIVVDDLGVDATLLAGTPGSLLAPEGVRGWLAPRLRNVHKGSFGTLGIVGGGKGMTGAAILAARAGLYAGAGKVYVGLLAPNPPAFDPVHPELMLRAVDDTLAADVLVVGPGAGHSPSATSISAFERVTLPALLSLPKPLVMDADALNAIAIHDTMRDALAGNRRAATILTPHPAEAARLLHVTTAEVQADRLGAAIALAASLRSEVVLKGAGSICASPDGTWAVNSTGDAGLSCGGSGDVLAGIIGALLCQGLPAPQALRYAVCLHGAASQSCTARGIGPAGLTAGEVALEARALLNAWTASPR
ncbi:MAG: NAD(P)H-hydrate dehydratase [Betaproteobacteria bacterium]|nr:NAD(P)H-hydrate dehydratase [Betaproteobacteria bacterium]